MSGTSDSGNRIGQAQMRLANAESSVASLQLNGITPPGTARSKPSSWPVLGNSPKRANSWAN
jgi:hypothetical protein